jgi:hypothetical protein
MVARIGYIDITTATDSDTLGEKELTVLRTRATESKRKTGRSGTCRDTDTSDRSRRA